jgi:hypothetical protein
VSKFTRKPKAQPGVEAFIGGAAPGDSASSDTISNDSIPNGLKPLNIQSSDTISSETDALPWDHPRVRDDVLKTYNLRLPEPYLLKLRFIAGNTPGSMQRFCLDALLPAIDAEITRLTRR